MNNQHQAIWVLAWRPFNPSGMFVSSVGDLSKGQQAIIAKFGVSNAMRMTKGEAEFLLDAIKAESSMSFYKELIIVSVADHMFKDEEI